MKIKILAAALCLAALFSATVCAAPSPGDSAEPTVSCKPVTAWVTYVVKRGDTLTGLVRDTG